MFMVYRCILASSRQRGAFQIRRSDLSQKAAVKRLATTNLWHEGVLHAKITNWEHVSLGSGFVKIR
jgi:hypothetical protein